jgi:hypothetical protein
MDVPQLSASSPGLQGHDVNLEVFVNQQLTKIFNESTGRSKEAKTLREQCKTLKGGRCHVTKTLLPQCPLPLSFPSPNSTNCCVQSL